MRRRRNFAMVIVVVSRKHHFGQIDSIWKSPQIFNSFLNFVTTRSGSKKSMETWKYNMMRCDINLEIRVTINSKNNWEKLLKSHSNKTCIGRFGRQIMDYGLWKWCDSEIIFNFSIQIIKKKRFLSFYFISYHMRPHLATLPKTSIYFYFRRHPNLGM